MAAKRNSFTHVLIVWVLGTIHLSHMSLHPSRAGEHIPELSRFHSYWNRRDGLCAINGSGSGVCATRTHSKGKEGASSYNTLCSLHPFVLVTCMCLHLQFLFSHSAHFDGCRVRLGNENQPKDDMYQWRLGPCGLNLVLRWVNGVAFPSHFNCWTQSLTVAGDDTLTRYLGA